MAEAGVTPLEVLVLALVIHGAGPLLFALSSRFKSALSFVDGAVLVAVLGLVLVEVVPAAIGAGGALAAAALAFGLVFPGLVGWLSTSAGERAERLAVGFSLVAVGLDSLIDGAAIGVDPEAGALSLAVLLHRLPVGLWVYGHARVALGRTLAIVSVVALMGATVAGFAFSSRLGLLEAEVAVFEAFVAGALLHVLAGHRLPGAPAHPGRVDRALGTAGAIVGLAIVFSDADHAHEAASPAVFGAMLDLIGAGGPALFLGYLIAGLVFVVVPEASLPWLVRDSRWGQAMRGAVFGLPVSTCSCSSTPMFSRLVQDGVGPAAAVAFLVAMPSLGFEAIVWSIALLGGTLALLRVAAVLGVAIAAGVLADRLASRVRPAPRGGLRFKTVPPGLEERVRLSISLGLGRVVDRTAAWVLLGLVVGATILAHGLPAEWRAEPLHVWVLGLTAAALPVYLSAAFALPVALALWSAGAPPGAALAFLIAAPSVGVASIRGLHRDVGPGAAVLVPGVIGAVAIGVGIVAGPALGAAPTLTRAPGLGEASAALLAIVAVSSMLRQGVRGFLHALFEGGLHVGEHGDHDDAPDHAGSAHGEHDHAGSAHGEHDHAGSAHGEDDHDHG